MISIYHRAHRVSSFLCVLCVLCGYNFSPLFAAESRLHDFSPQLEAWVTGPLLTPSAVVVQRGHYNIEPYVYATANTAVYDNDWHSTSIPTLWTISSQTSLQVGVTDWLDFQVTPVLNWNHQRSAGYWALGDMVAQFDAQLYLAPLQKYSWVPSVRFTLKETIPVGKYRNLRLNKSRTDSSGFGSWVTTASLGFSKIVDLDSHFLVYRLNCNYSFYYTPVHVTGLNAYGGGFGTNGTVYPGNTAQVQLGLEYTLTQNWVLALDMQGTWGATDRFTGDRGDEQRNNASLIAIDSLRANIQYSLAPAIEYNWSGNLGLIAGVWFTVAGKNTAQFTSGVIALNYYK